MEKKDKEKLQSSLYTFMGLAFLIILAVEMVFTAVYFGMIRNYIIDTKGNEIVINEFVNSQNASKILEGLKGATIYGLFVGIALMIVVIARIIKPLRSITNATKKVASGDFTVKVDTKRKDEIGRLANNFNLMVDELNSIEYLRKDFISNISHELKTPLASIQGFAKLLEDENISHEEKKEYINIILEETSRLSNLSSNMIKLSKFENQEIITNKKTYKLDEQLRKAIILMEEKINEKNIKINLKSESISIVQDEELIMEIWLNLLNNAIKYTEKNGKIDITVEKDLEHIIVTVKDTGIGISKEQQGKIFDKFYQIDTSHSSDGSGLGLPIVKRIIDLIDGKIEVESEINKGTAFKVFLKSHK